MSKARTSPLERGTTPWLLTAALATTLPHLAHQPLWLGAFTCLMLLWGFVLWWHNQPLPQRWLLMFAVAIACAGILIEYRSLFGRDAGVAMLVLFMAMKLLEVKSRRDGVIVITLGYFLLLTHYFYSQSIPTGLWLLGALWLITACLVRLHGDPHSTVKYTLRYAALLILQAVPFMLLLYLLFPRISGPLWGLPQDAHAGRTGLSEQMSPGSISSLVQNGEIAFRVRFAGEVPAKEKLYWRGPVMEDFDGLTWRPYVGRYAPGKVESTGPLIEYETTLEAHNQRWLLALEAPFDLASELAVNGALTANNHSLITDRQRFRLKASPDYRFNVIESAQTLQRNLRLPAGKNPRTLLQGKLWQVSAHSPERIIQNALELFSGDGFTYTLQPPPLGENGVDDFLFTTKRGFCEHYTAAFVVLMRAAGIPARVVGGYQGGEINPVDGYLVVRQSDAHAWAEVWLENRGWIRIDPTAAVSPSRIESGIGLAMPSGEPLPALVQVRSAWLRTLRHRWEAVNNHWNQYILGYDAQRQRELLASLGVQDADWKTLASILAGSCSIMLSIILFLTLRQRPPQDPARQIWEKALHRLARRKVNCPPWETPMALARRLETECPEIAAPFAKIAIAYLDARYGKYPDKLHELRKAFSQLP